MNNKPQTILCEGASEYAYIQELNRLLVKNTPSCGRAFIPRCIGSGFFGQVKKIYKNEKQRNPKDKILIWVDKDLYMRNERNCADDYAKKSEFIPDFFFSIMNFEDFLILHCEPDVIKNWLAYCTKKKHFITPMHACDYEPAFEKIFPGYQKGELPFILTKVHVQRMIENLNKYKIDNDFGCYLSEQIQSGELKFI